MDAQPRPEGQVVLQGPLYKWTNYLSGWQARWFILSDGILSYYSSKDAVSGGCRGSYTMSSSEVIGKALPLLLDLHGPVYLTQGRALRGYCA